MDPQDPVPASDRGYLLREFAAETTDVLLELAGPPARTPLLMVEVRALGGAMADEPAAPAAVSGWDARWSYYTVGILVPEIAEAVPA